VIATRSKLTGMLDEISPAGAAQLVRIWMERLSLAEAILTDIGLTSAERIRAETEKEIYSVIIREFIGHLNLTEQ
jgi:hypothetical protein